MKQVSPIILILLFFVPGMSLGSEICALVGPPQQAAHQYLASIQLDQENDSYSVDVFKVFVWHRVIMLQTNGVFALNPIHSFSGVKRSESDKIIYSADELALSLTQDADQRTLSGSIQMIIDDRSTIDSEVFPALGIDQRPVCPL